MIVEDNPISEVIKTLKDANKQITDRDNSISADKEDMYFKLDKSFVGDADDTNIIKLNAYGDALQEKLEPAYVSHQKSIKQY